MNEGKVVKIIKTSDAGPFEDHIWKYELILPEWLSKWDVWDYWEKERIFSMERELKKGDILFDVGSESGWMSVLFGKYFVGGENMVLFEPSEKYWPTIREIWNMNLDVDPLYCKFGFVGNSNKRNKVAVFDGKWPLVSQGEKIESGMPYAYMHNKVDSKKIPIIMIDRFVEDYKIVPRGITIDVEGAELEVIKGSLEVLKNNDVLVWISIHPDLMLKNYKVSKEALIMVLNKIGYVGELLGIDHEEHWLFRKRVE